MEIFKNNQVVFVAEIETKASIAPLYRSKFLGCAWPRITVNTLAE